MTSKNKYMVLISLGYAVTSLSMEKSFVVKTYVDMDKDSIVDNYVDTQKLLMEDGLSQPLREVLIERLKNNIKFEEEEIDREADEFFLVKNEPFNSKVSNRDTYKKNENSTSLSYMGNFLRKFEGTDFNEYYKYVNDNDFKEKDFAFISREMAPEERQNVKKDTQDQPVPVGLKATLYSWFYKKQ